MSQFCCCFVAVRESVSNKGMLYAPTLLLIYIVCVGCDLSIRSCTQASCVFRDWFSVIAFHILYTLLLYEYSPCLARMTIQALNTLRFVFPRASSKAYSHLFSCAEWRIRIYTRFIRAHVHFSTTTTTTRSLFLKTMLVSCSQWFNTLLCISREMTRVCIYWVSSFYAPGVLSNI